MRGQVLGDSAVSFEKGMLHGFWKGNQDWIFYKIEGYWCFWKIPVNAERIGDGRTSTKILIFDYAM